jgi:capsular polysaccharide biosynthesis protein/Mrp family chromosome partitioning ATPase
MPVTDDSGNTLFEYISAFRRRWWLVALVMLATVAVGALYTLRQPTLYRSTMKIVVGQQGGVFQPGIGNVADEFTQTMSDLLQSEVVASRAIREVGLDITPAELLAKLHVTTKPSSTVLNVSYDDQDLERGTRSLRAIGDEFTSLVAERLAKGNANLTVSATVFNPAHFLGKVQPKPARNLAVAGMLGLLLGILVAFVREQLDDTVRSVEQAEQAFGQVATVTIPPGIVGYHPFARGEGKRADPVITELSLQRLRATILWSPETTEAPTLLVTSANPAEGKTTIAANLAVLMVTEGRNVIVVDADLRHPTLYRYLGMPLPMGDLNLDAVMAGHISPLGALVEVPVPARAFTALDGAGQRLDSWTHVRREPPASGRLRAILAGTARRQLGEFDLARTVEVIQTLRSDADVVIIDGPPILVVPDAYPFAASADAVIAVVRNGQASMKATVALSRTLERLRARRIELVVTDAEPGFAQSYYYYQGREGEVASARGEPRGANVLAGESAMRPVARRAARRGGTVRRDR